MHWHRRDSIIGTSFIDHLRRFKDDPETTGVVIIGEIGGSAEEEAAEYVGGNSLSPCLPLLRARPLPGQADGHAGAIISGGKGKAEDKIKALESAGITVVHNLGKFGEAAVALMKKA